MKITQTKTIDIYRPEELKPYLHESVVDMQAIKILFDLFDGMNHVDVDWLKQYRVTRVTNFLEKYIRKCDSDILADALTDVIEWNSSREQMMIDLLGTCQYDYWILDHDGKESMDDNLEILYVNAQLC